MQFELWEGRAQDKESSLHVTDQGTDWPCLQEPCFGEFPSDFMLHQNLQFDIFIIFSIQLLQKRIPWSANINASLMAVVESPDLFNILKIEECR